MNIHTSTADMQDEAYAYMATRSKPGPLLIFSFFLIFLYVSPIYNDQPKEILVIGICLVAISIFRLINEFGFHNLYFKNKTVWSNLYSLSIAANALVWGVFCLIVVAEYGIDWVSLLVLICTAGLSAGGIIAVIPHQKLSFAYQSFILLPTAIYSFTLENAAAYSISYMFFCYLIFMSLMSKKLHSEYWTSVQNVRLLDERAKELEISRDEAVKLAKSKSAFLATMSHELRTPMNGILGMSQLLELSDLSKEQSEYVSTINSSTNLLLNLINDILDFSKMESGKVTLELESFNINSLVNDIYRLLKTATDEKKINFACQIDQNCPKEFVGDKGRIRQVLLNLLGNAIKFTTTGSIKIKVDCIEPDSNCRVRFSVSDTGIGINPSKQTQIFSAFTQADSSTTRKYGGTGLGLAISKQLVTLMHGEIGIQSQENVGSTFWFEVPLSVSGLINKAKTNVDNPETPNQMTIGFVLDSRVLSQLKETMEDQFPELIEMHIESATKNIENIRQCIINKDLKKLAAYLNSLKSSSASIGAKTLELETAHYEKRLRENGDNLNDAEFEKLVDLYNQMVNALKNELK